MKVLYDKNNNFNLTIKNKYLNTYNKERENSNLRPINDVSHISRHDPLLIEIVESDPYENTLCISEILSDDYCIIVENGMEIIIEDPVREVNNLFNDLRNIYYNNLTNIHLQCNSIFGRIISIINTYK